MPSEWIIEFYADDDGHKPVYEYIQEKDDKTTALLLQLVKRLRNLGPDIQGTNMDKLIEGPIRELRKDRHRILYGRHGNRFILLTAFLKETQKTPRTQVELAKKRYSEHINRK